MTHSTCSAQKKTGGQQEGEYRWVQHIQGEYYQRNVTAEKYWITQNHHNLSCWQDRVRVQSPKPKVKEKRERGIWTLGCIELHRITIICLVDKTESESQSKIEKGKRNFDSGLSLTQYDPLYLFSTKKNRWRASGRIQMSSTCSRRILSKKYFKSICDSVGSSW